jgi:hypothetical protein
MKFRDYDVGDVLIIECGDQSVFEKKLKDIMENHKVIDLQYSTRTSDYRYLDREINNICTTQITTWSALILIGK